MQGLVSKKHHEHLELVQQETAQLALLAKGDGVEVMTQSIRAGKVFSVAPGEHEELMEFFFLLAGRINYDSEAGVMVELRQGDYFYAHHLKSMVIFRVLEDVTLLYVSTQPLFHYLSRSIADLSEIARQSREKDMYTHNHGERVKTYALEIGGCLGLSKERIENLGYASLFHDIGKIKVPDEVLRKPGRLDETEMGHIKRHPSDAAKMVQETYFADIAEIVHQHHERLDGSGYPRGLQGEEISLEARIIAVADSFDAMTTDRPYRKALGVEESLIELQALSEKHYDARVVEALVNLVRDKVISV